MTCLIRLTQEYGYTEGHSAEVWLNPDHIVEFHEMIVKRGSPSTERRLTRIAMVNGDVIKATASAEEVAAAIYREDRLRAEMEVAA